MEDKGYKVASSDGKVRVWKKNFKNAFTLGFRVDSLYQVGGSPLGVMSCDTSLQSELWHRRFAHLHYKALPNVRKMVTRMPEFRLEQEGVCPRCAEGKLKGGPFPSSQSKTSDILQLVHSDISSMMPVNSLGGYLYYLTFIDDYSCKTWIYFLKKKDEVFSRFQHFKALIENQTEKKIKILRTDNGTEYESNEFHDFCKEAGIKRETTTPYTPKQNGVAERKNLQLWKLSVLCSMIKDFRSFYGPKLQIPLFMYKTNALIKHWVPRLPKKCSPGYRIYVGGQREVEIRHDVTFDEDMALSKVDNLPTLRGSKEADTGEPKEKEDETMPDVEEPMDLIDPPPQEPSSSRKRSSWLRGTLDDVEGHIAPRGTFCESKKPNRYQGYLTIMSTIIQNEPSSFTDAVKHQVWKDAMTEEYEFIMKNDVWDVVPRSQNKAVVTSKWLYKIKHAVDGSAESIRLVLSLVASPRRKV
eukprot:PITA_36299